MEETLVDPGELGELGMKPRGADKLAYGVRGWGNLALDKAL